MAESQPQFNRIRIANPPLEGNNRTFLTSDVDVAATALPVISTSGAQFLITGDQDYYIIVEDYGMEKAEIKLVDAGDAGTDTNSFTVAALTYSHEASDPITFISFNQIKIYGATTSGGAKTELDAIDIDPTKQYTEYIYEGDTYSFFYAAYSNSTDEELSAYTEEITSTDLGRTSAQQVINSALKKAMTKLDENEDGKLSWEVAIETMNDGLDEIMARKRKWVFLHTIDSTTTDTVADTAYVEKLSDIAILENLIINDIRLLHVSRLAYNQTTKGGNTLPSGDPYYYTVKDDKYYLEPTPGRVLDVTYEYFKYPTEVSNPGDAIDKPFVSILKYYCAAQFSWIRGNEKRGDKMFALYEKALERQVEEFTGPDQLGDADSTEHTNSTLQEDEAYFI